MYEEEEFLQLSGIQHFAFCRRQWALIHVERVWEENVRTVEGMLLHKKVHDVTSQEKRKDLITTRAMPVYSREMGVSGECDVVEFHRSESGISISGREGLYEIVPVEYKRGKPKDTDIDILQLTAQAMCLEEMLCCSIPFGYLYYGETRHRKQIIFGQEIRQKAKDMFLEMHQYFGRGYTPRVKWSKSCNACSLQDICLPSLGRKKSVKAYIEKCLSEEDTD